MGYKTKDIAVITEPRTVSLSGAPNFVTFASKPAVKTFLEINVQVNALAGDQYIEDRTLLQVVEPSGIIHAFYGTDIPADVTGTVFYVSEDPSDTAENLREAMLANRWISANLEIRIPFELAGGVVSNGRVLNIKSKGTGAEYNIVLTAPNNIGNAAYTITPVQATSVSGDSISGEDGTAEIELDVYTGVELQLGEDDTPTTPAKMGELALTMQKTYAGAPLWFDVNAIFRQYQGFNSPFGATGWFNTGTARVFRFVARKKAINSFSFYQSSALFVLNGYGYASETVDLAPYIYKDNTIKLLTNKPRTPYVAGQREFLNFVFGDYGLKDYPLSIIYRAYTTADVFIGEAYGQIQSSTLFKTVNTCALDIDAVLATYPTAGIVRVGIARGTVTVSNYLEYLIRPQALHQLTQFTFLNKLGGWDTFNFDSPVKQDIKQQTETYSKTLTPEYAKGDSIETVYTSALEESRTVEGAPITDDVAEWLKELAASRVVLDGEGNYVIKEDFTLQISAASFNMQVPTIKYKLSETYTND